MYRLLFFSAIIAISCGTPKKVITAKPIEKKHEVVKVKSLPDKIDTVVWKELPTKAENKTTSNEDKKDKLFKPVHQIKLSVLIPFKSNEIDTTERIIPISNLRFVHYYAGMKIALEEFKTVNNLPIQLDVFDTGDPDKAKEILLASQASLPQIVIGPYRSESIKYAAEWAKKNQTYIISPWISSSTITDKNPYYIQAKAGLIAHYQLINDHVRSHFPIENVVLIARSKEESKSKLFNNFNDDKREIKEEIISEEELATGSEPLLEKYFKVDDPTVFILPMSSLKDENYIYHFLRRVQSEKKNKVVFIYGLYKWLEMKSEIQEYINALNVRVSISNFVDNDRPEVRSFKRKYFEVYKEFPSNDAMEGYDLMKYIIYSLSKYGNILDVGHEDTVSDYLETQYLFKPVSKTSSENTRLIDYYENAFIKIIEIKENKYKIID